MPDWEKVIKGLHCCSHTDGIICLHCPYDNDGEDCTALMSMDVLELLKEQEEQIEQLEHDLAVTQNNLNYYVNGND